MDSEDISSKMIYVDICMYHLSVSRLADMGE